MRTVLTLASGYDQSVFAYGLLASLRAVRMEVKSR